MFFRAYKSLFTLYPAILMQALFGLNQMIMLILGALSAQYILNAELSYLSTVPAGIMLLSAFLMTPIAGKLIENINYKGAFFIGGVANIVGAACFAFALYKMSFSFLLLSAVFYGVFQSFSGFLRFVAADHSACCKKENAIAMTIGGGTLAAIIAPLFIAYTQALTLPQLYLGTLLMLTIINITGLIVPLLIRNNDLYKNEINSSRKKVEKVRFSSLIKRKNFLAASLSGLTSSAMMHFLIVVTPIAIIGCGLSTMEASLAVQTHAIAMLLPSFIVGYLIKKITERRTIILGLGLLVLSSIFLNAGNLTSEVTYFQMATVCLGLGWGITYIASGKLLLSCYCSCDKTGVQATNEMIIAGGSAILTMAAGALYHYGGMDAVTSSCIILVFSTIIIVIKGTDKISKTFDINDIDIDSNTVKSH